MVDKIGATESIITWRMEIWREGKLVDVQSKELCFDDLIVDAGLDAACGCVFDSSESRPAAFDYIAIGTDGTAPANSQTALGAEVMRVKATYTKDGTTGECSIDAIFNITGSFALKECGIFNDPSAGTMYCRDTFTVRNVDNGDTVKIYYTGIFRRGS